MNRLYLCRRVGGLMGLVLALAPAPLGAQDPTGKKTAEVVVSATKTPEDPAEIAGTVEVVPGDVLRRSGARTVAEAIQDVVGIDTGGGSDNGPRLPNIGMWGLKEFDALLVTVDGIPVGGPFNPSLAQIPVEDIDRIEISKGPQGTLYGVSAFAGMVQVFTKRTESPGGSATVGGGSFSDRFARLSYDARIGADFDLKVFGSMSRGKGFQDRTDYSTDRLTVSGEKRWGDARLDVSLIAFRDSQLWGSPIAVDPPSGQTIPGFQIDRNYAVDGARMDHRVTALSSTLTLPLATGVTLANVLGVTRDEQNSVRSFISAVDGNAATAAGVAIRPLETSVYDDLHLSAAFRAAGLHELVTGAALTWGRTTAAGIGFDIDLQLDPVVVPSFSDITVGDHRSFQDRRTFLGFYLNDAWTPTPRLTITAGARYDLTSEALSAFGQEVGSPTAVMTTDSRTDGQWSGGVSALFRLVEKPTGLLDTANLFVSLRSAFKPAAPNLTEAESARILAPERTHSGEIGLKTRWANKTVSLDASLFHMTMENIVVSVVGPDGLPMLVNAGEERFQGAELSLGFHPAAVPGLSFTAGYAHHDATYVHFTFIDPDNGPTTADGQRLELTPRDLWNVSLRYHPERQPVGAWVAVRHQNSRPFDKINEAYMPAFFEWDAGLSVRLGRAEFSLWGRNLGNDRHFVAESEIGDAQLYAAPPRRFGAQVTVRF